MNKIKTVLKNKKIIVTIVSIALVVCGIGGYLFYDNSRKQEIINKMSITFTDISEVEYGTKDFDIQKELVNEVTDAEIKTLPTIDTSKIGEVELIFTLEKSKLTKDVTHKIKVVDTKAPEITLEAEAKELTVGDEYDFMTNITSVKDVVDGDISLNKDAPEVNKQATEAYSKLSKEDIKDDTKIGNKDLNEFLVDTVKGEDGKETSTLYLKNCYYVDGSVDIATAGEYTINVVAVDKNGMKSTKEFKITVKEKEVAQPVSAPSSSGGGRASNGGGNSGGSSSSSSSSSSGGASVSKGSIQDVINTAYSIGNAPYVSGGKTPSGVDCNGYIYYAYTQNGYNIPSNIANAGYQVAYYPEGTGLDPSLIRAGDIIITEGTDLFGKYKYHARLATGGDNYCQVGLTFSSSGLYEGTKIFNITVRRVV